MPTSDVTTVLPLLSLPVELIVETAVWAQILWLQDEIFTYVPGASVRRLETAPAPRVLRDEACCRHVDRSVLPGCLNDQILRVKRSPAHSLSETCKWLRGVLCGTDTRVWKLDNTLYKLIAERSGVISRVVSGVPGGPTLEYGSHHLIASPSCACLIRGIKPFFHSLVDLKLALPWEDPVAPASNTETFFMDNRDDDGPLRRFDLEIYDSPRSHPRPIIQCLYSSNVEYSRTINAAFFYTSPALTSLCLYLPSSRQPRFSGSFWTGLEICAKTLQRMTLDVADGLFLGGEGFIKMTKLRYLHLVARASECTWLLQALELPPDLDLHVEPIVDWRRACALPPNVPVAAGDIHLMNVPFLAIEAAADARERPHGLWRFLSAVAAPDQTSTIFHAPPFLSVRRRNLNHVMKIVGLDVRLDPSTSASERACGRFPELVAVTFVETLQELQELYHRGERDWRGSQEPGTKQRARRSLTIRDGAVKNSEREQFFRPHLAKPVYDSVAHVLRLLMDGQPGTPFTGFSHVRALALHPRSWKPAYSLGWAHILERCERLTDLALLCERVCSDGEPFAEIMEGPLAPVQLEALAIYLNEVTLRSGYPCRGLERVHIRCLAQLDEDAAAFATRWERRFNTKARMKVAGTQRISVIT